MPLNIQNLEWLRKLSPQSLDDLHQLGPKLYQALKSVQDAHNAVELQTNTNSHTEPTAPPPINNLHVSASNGHFQVAITDNNEIYRGVQYFVEHADNPNFTNAVQTQASGTSKRNHNEYLGDSARYFRAYSAYGTGPASKPVYHGGAQPVAVTGGGSVGGPAFLPSQGSGTGAAGQGLVGNGDVQFRSSTGLPPVRKP